MLPQSSGKRAFIPKNTLNWVDSLIAGINASSCKYDCSVLHRSEDPRPKT